MAINPSRLIPRPVATTTQIENSTPILDVLISIEKNLKSINTIVTSTSTNMRKINDQDRIKKEESARSVSEKEKESTTQKNIDPNLFLSGATPKVGFLDGIKNFILYTFMGFAITKLFKYLPQILKIVQVIKPIIDFTELFIGTLFTATVNAIDFGYKQYDKVRGLVKQVGGEKYEKIFDDLSKNLNDYLNKAIIIGLAIAGSGQSDWFKPKIPPKKPPTSPTGTPKNNRRPPGGGGGGTSRVTNRGSRLPPNIPKPAGKFGKALRFGSIPIIGSLINFAFDVATGVDPGKAAAGAVGAGIGMAIGDILGGLAVGALALGTGGVGLLASGLIMGAISIAGSTFGDMIGKSLYDATLGNQEKPKKHATGGRVSPSGGSKVGGPIKRTLRREPKRIKSSIPQKSQPGKNIGGLKNIEKLFQNSTDPKQRSALRSLQHTSQTLKTGPTLIRGIMGDSIDIAMGQAPNRFVYKEFAENIGNIVQNTIDTQSDGMFAMADGGVVGRTLGGPSIGEKVADSIASSLDSMLNNRVNVIFQNIMKELNLTDPSGGGGGGGGPGGPVTGLQGNAKEYYDYLISKGLEPNNALGITLNVDRESKFNPSDSHIDSNNLMVGGAFQWNGPRFAAMIKAVPDWKTNWKGQIDYAINESVGPQYQKQKFNSPLEAADWWMEKWEVPLNPAADSAKMRETYNLWQKQGMTQGQGPPGAGPESMVTGGTPGVATSGFGWRWGKMHKGIDIDGGNNSPISSAQDATVVHSGWKNDGYGYSVVLKYSNGAETRFGHLSQVNVRRGEKISAGQLIGKEGSTGSSTGPHLHFEYFPSGNAMSYSGQVDPASVVNSYLRFGGSVRAKVANKPMDSVGTPTLENKPKASPTPTGNTQQAQKTGILKLGKRTYFERGGKYYMSEENNLEYDVGKEMYDMVKKPQPQPQPQPPTPPNWLNILNPFKPPTPERPSSNGKPQVFDNSAAPISQEAQIARTTPRVTRLSDTYDDEYTDTIIAIQPIIQQIPTNNTGFAPAYSFT